MNKPSNAIGIERSRSQLAGGPRPPCGSGGTLARRLRPDRVTVRLLGCLAMGAILFVSFGKCSARADWPLVRGNAAATGADAAPLPQPFDILWTYEADGSGFEATASIVDGIIYLGDIDGTFHAVSLADGKPVWTKKFEETGFVAGSAVVDGRIYCVDFNGVVWCLKAEDGETVWQFSSDTSLYAAPNVYKELVLIVGDSGELIALDAKSGDVRWKFSIDQPLRCWPTVVAERVLVAGCDGKLHSVDVNTGKDVESIDIGGPADGMPAVMGDRVFFCTAGGVFHATSINPLKSEWEFGHRGQGEEIHAAAVIETAVLLGTHDKRAVALKPATGEVIWSVPLASRAESSPVIAGDLAFFGTVRGRLHAFETATGREVWNTEVGGRFTASPALSDGRLVIGNDDGTLYCVGKK